MLSTPRTDDARWFEIGPPPGLVDLPLVVGRSPALLDTLRKAESVARTEATVLVLGETGTGKELIARAIHAASARRAGPFVRVNAAAIPTGLLESELFGHERGAFTGAVSRRVGRFEAASDGTIFLDEIGEMSLDAQPKVLRVLQEREFERLGGTQTLRSNARLVAATHRDLFAMVADKGFREDLYYRLSVFPILVPPLRARREDIPSLVHHIVGQLARRMGKGVVVVTPPTMARLQAHDWPGNIRELQNVLERAMILARGPTLQVDLPEARAVRTRAPAGEAAASDDLRDVERAHIISVLRKTNWIVGGPGGAAARLGLKRTTLNFRIKRLGITREGPHALTGSSK